MGERKVINKYFPPDFDPTKIPRQKKANINPNFVVRMMLPMSVRCQTCGEYMYKGKKFNSRKEDVEGPEGEYLGIKIFRFYFKCVTCSAEFTIKTDPKNMDYEVEAGVKRNFEPYKDVEAQKKAQIEAREASEQDDAMAKLENKTKDSKMEMDILDALDEIRTQNARHAGIKVDDVIERHRQQSAQLAAASSANEELREDEAAALQEFATARMKRLRDDDEAESPFAVLGAAAGGTTNAAGKQRALGTSSKALAQDGASTTASGSSADGAASSAPPRGAAFAKPPPPVKKPKLPNMLIIQSKTKASAQDDEPSAAATPNPATTGTTPSPAAPVEDAGGATSAGAALGLAAYDSNSNSDHSSGSP